jgi:exodeoxyribonuclease-5
MGLTKEQRFVFKHLLKNPNGGQVQTCGGFAGTGKTTLLAALAEALPDYACCAFTGKAAHVMRQRGLTASTIHSLIFKPLWEPDDPDAEKAWVAAGREGPRPSGKLRFCRKDRAELGCSGFLVDEASMVGEDLRASLLSFKLPIIFVGDHGQLPPIGSDVYLMKKPDVKLETIHRNAGPIAYFAQHLRKGNPARTFPTGAGVRLLEPGEVTDQRMLLADQVITAFNRDRVGLNRTVRKLLDRGEGPEPGDRIICLRNNHQAGLFNGQQGVVDKVDPEGCLLDFVSDDGTAFSNVKYDPDQFGKEKTETEWSFDGPNPFDYAYAVTCHKAQGSEWGKVLAFEGYCPYWDSKRWAYTAASRAKKSLAWVAPGRCWATGGKKKAKAK